jgi:N-acetylglucosaminyl-diphospho-decaprenol L-rhamnosyltransferase
LASLDIVIVNWNSGRQLHDCLTSVALAERGGLDLRRVVVVDNGSQDGSLGGLEDLDLPLEVCVNNENRGFGAACNQGALGSEEGYLLFLNPDTRLSPSSLTVPVEYMERAENQNIGICGIQLVDENGAVTRSCARFPGLMSLVNKMLGLDRLRLASFRAPAMTEWDHLESAEVDQVMGAFFLIRRSLFESLAGFDQRFFVYFEEVDLAYRAKRKGWKSFYLVDTKAFHKGGGTSEQIKAKRLFYNLRSRILYGYKNLSRWKAHLLLVLTLFIEPISRVSFSLARGSFSQVRETAVGYILLWESLFRLLFLRRDESSSP